MSARRPRFGAIAFVTLLAGALGACGSSGGDAPPSPSVSASASPGPTASGVGVPRTYPYTALDGADPCAVIQPRTRAELGLAAPAGRAVQTGPGTSCGYVALDAPTAGPVVSVFFDGDTTLPQWAASHGAVSSPVQSIEYPVVVVAASRQCLAAVAVTPDQVLSVARDDRPDDRPGDRSDCSQARLVLLVALGGVRAALSD